MDKDGSNLLHDTKMKALRGDVRGQEQKLDCLE
jgi:hypothetical protein